MISRDVPLGVHWIFDASDVPESCLTREHLFHVLVGLPAHIGVRRVSEPQIFAQDNGEPSVAGIVLLADSHLSLHAIPQRGLLHGDLFSCKPYDLELAREYVRQQFRFGDCREAVFNRGAAPRTTHSG